MDFNAFIEAKISSITRSENMYLFLKQQHLFYRPFHISVVML